MHLSDGFITIKVKSVGHDQSNTTHGLTNSCLLLFLFLLLLRSPRLKALKTYFFFHKQASTWTHCSHRFSAKVGPRERFFHPALLTGCDKCARLSWKKSDDMYFHAPVRIQHHLNSCGVACLHYLETTPTHSWWSRAFFLNQVFSGFNTRFSEILSC